MANIATLALREKKWLDAWLEQDFGAFVADKTDELRAWGYVRVPGWIEGVDAADEVQWWKNWYEEEKEDRQKKIKEKWQLSINKKYEFIWEQQIKFAEARAKVMEATGIESSSNTFFITLRPAETATFREFYDKVKDIVERKMFPAWTLSFEQKGTSTDELGKGFHVHIIAKSTCRSKGEILRALTGTYDENKTKWVRGSLSSWINEGKIAMNCIDVGVCKNPKATTRRYLVDYESDDGHKIITKEWDDKWRIDVGLQALYTSDIGLGHLPIKSNRQVTFA